MVKKKKIKRTTGRKRSATVRRTSGRTRSTARPVSRK